MDRSKLIIDMENDCKVLAHAHRNNFSRFKNLHIRLGLPAALLATAAGSLTTIASNEAGVSGDYSFMELAGLLCTWTVALFTAATTFLRPQEVSQGHKEKAGAYEVLLTQIRVACEYLSNEDRRAEVERISEEMGKLKQAEPFLSNVCIVKSKEELTKRGELAVEQQPSRLAEAKAA